MRCRPSQTRSWWGEGGGSVAPGEGGVDGGPGPARLADVELEAFRPVHDSQNLHPGPPGERTRRRTRCTEGY